ncbi:synaptonemal complex protein 2-like isoform X1 [Siniperca chuatsi]|uniref:synaptonemal complex protein 2-like isoform X1 n=1 Tax=Siniperca chuatsi TaxID=119488 RepID=UPI001CE0DECF|nr:synaptonemal complex protein 2-like isoform X1 [Siniperca chuatsi]XP_044032709.1 synaptonemal complex protein 2-like isoform X1 [Siniperca chuatsi]
MMEVKVEDCLIRGDSSDLVSVLHYEGLTSTTLTRLDQVVTKDLRGSSFSRVLVVLKSLEILSENRDDRQTLIDHGLTAKVVVWFEAVHDLLTSDLQKNSAPLLSLAEEFYDYFLLLGQSSLPVSQLSVVLLQLARFALESEIHFPLRLEAIRTFNSILESLSREQRRLIQNDQNQTQILSQVAAAVLTVGDYELQVSLSEALCRLTPRKDREQRANQWFSSRDISSAFCDIRDGDFEVDCRRFLNFVNCYHGDLRRVYTFPCRRAFLDSTELFRPKDDKLDAFWIDFNLSSGCVSFFIDEPQGFLWGSIHLLKEEVDQYSLQVNLDGCTGAETILRVRLNNPIMHHNCRGQTVELNFDSEHHRELEEAAGRVFMKVKSSPRLKDTGGTVQVSPSATKQTGRSYSRKKPQSKSQLKILPLSSPSSEEDSSVMKTRGRNAAELLFDQIRHSTPTYDSGVPVGAELKISQEQTEEFGGSSSPLKNEVFSFDRKRTAPDSGYLSDQTEGQSSHKRRAEQQQEGEESNSLLTEGSPEGANPPEEEEEEEEGLFGEVVESHVEKEGPVMESGITSAFNTFKKQLEQHFNGCQQNVETEVLLSLKECQQHVSSLLTAVHQQRCVLLQRFENSVTDQLNRLQENSTSLNSINTQILSFFQSEMQRLGSFCDEHLQSLKTLESGELGTEHSSSQ